MKHIYHYYAECEDSHSINKIDGIIDVNKTIGSYEDYNEIKKWIIEKFQLNKDISKTNIINLSYLGTKETKCN